MPDQTPESDGPSKPPMRFRRVRIAVSVFFALVAVALCVLWVRSQDHIDRLTWHYRRPRAIQVGTEPGRIDIKVFTDAPTIIPATNSHPSRQLWTPFVETMRLYGGVTNWTPEIMNDPSGTIIAIPQWLLVTMLGLFASASWLITRFSLRALLIATTLLAVLLGLGVWLAR